MSSGVFSPIVHGIENVFFAITVLGSDAGLIHFEGVGRVYILSTIWCEKREENLR